MGSSRDRILLFLFLPCKVFLFLPLTVVVIFERLLVSCFRAKTQTSKVSFYRNFVLVISRGTIFPRVCRVRPRRAEPARNSSHFRRSNFKPFLLFVLAKSFSCMDEIYFHFYPRICDNICRDTYYFI